MFLSLKNRDVVSLSYLPSTYFLIDKSLQKVGLLLEILFFLLFSNVSLTAIERMQLHLKQKLWELCVSNVKSLTKDAFLNNHFVTSVLKHRRSCRRARPQYN